MARASHIRRASGNEFKGQQVAVAFNRHECLPSHPKKKGEHCFPVRAKATSSSKVLAYVDEIWLEDVSFFVSPSGLRSIQQSGARTVCCFVVGTVIGSRSSGATKKHGWSPVRLDVFDHGCFIAQPADKQTDLPGLGVKVRPDNREITGVILTARNTMVLEIQ